MPFDRAAGGCALALAATLLAGRVAAAGGSADPAPLDGVVAVLGAAAGDEGTTLCVLQSDIELQAIFGALLAGRAPASSASADGTALRRTLLVALLARQAVLSGEEIDPAAEQAIIDRVTTAAGGAEALAALLERQGAAEADLATWAGDVSLAARQIEYLRERLEPPSDKELLQRFERGDHPFAGLGFTDARRRLRAYIVDEAVRRAVAAQLAEAIEQGAVRIFR